MYNFKQNNICNISGDSISCLNCNCGYDFKKKIYSYIIRFFLKKKNLKVRFLSKKSFDLFNNSNLLFDYFISSNIRL